MTWSPIWFRTFAAWGVRCRRTRKEIDCFWGPSSPILKFGSRKTWLSRVFQVSSRNTWFSRIFQISSRNTWLSRVFQISSRNTWLSRVFQISSRNIRVFGFSFWNISVLRLLTFSCRDRSFGIIVFFFFSLLVRLFVCLSFCLFVFLFVCPFVCLSFCFFFFFSFLVRSVFALFFGFFCNKIGQMFEFWETARSLKKRSF